VFILADNKPVHIHIVQPQVSNKYSENFSSSFAQMTLVSLTQTQSQTGDCRLALEKTKI